MQFLGGMGVNSGSGSGYRSIFGLYSRLGCSPISFSPELIGGSTPDPYLWSTPAPVPSQFHLRSLWWGVNSRSGSGSRSIFQLFIFYLNFHCIEIMLTLCYLQYSTFCPITPFQVITFKENPFTNKALFRQSFWVQTILFYLQNWSFCPIILFISILCALCLHKPYFYFSSAIS